MFCGYREADRKTPFTKGYLLTWIDLTLGRDAGIRKAIEVTGKRLIDEEDRNPVVHRIRMICDLIVAAAVHKEILSKDFLREKLGCTEGELDRAILRTMQLYSDIAEIKLFDAVPPLLPDEHSRMRTYQRQFNLERTIFERRKAQPTEPATTSSLQ